jgi:hypothetical protein
MKQIRVTESHSLKMLCMCFPSTNGYKVEDKDKTLDEYLSLGLEIVYVLQHNDRPCMTPNEIYFEVEEAKHF